MFACKHVNAPSPPRFLWRRGPERGGAFWNYGFGVRRNARGCGTPPMTLVPVPTMTPLLLIACARCNTHTDWSPAGILVFKSVAPGFSVFSQTTAFGFPLPLVVVLDHPTINPTSLMPSPCADMPGPEPPPSVPRYCQPMFLPECPSL